MNSKGSDTCDREILGKNYEEVGKLALKKTTNIGKPMCNTMVHANMHASTHTAHQVRSAYAICNKNAFQ